MEILQEDPYVWALHSDKLDQFCSFCLQKQTTNRQLLRCTKCKKIHYCNTGCQKSDWSEHKIECQRLQRFQERKSQKLFDPELEKLSPDFPNDGLRILCRLVEKNSKKKFKNFDSNGRKYSDLISHSDNISRSDEWRKDFKDLCVLYREFVGEDKRNIHERTLLEGFGKIIVNSFGMLDSNLKQIGIGLYLSLSRMDHSCNPNARIVYRGKQAVVVPTREICFSSQPDLSSLYHSYIENLETKQERHKKLRQSYCFDCNCNGCSDTKRNNTMVGFCCTKEKCKGIVNPPENDDVQLGTPCDVCNRYLEADDIATALMAKQMCHSVVDSLALPSSTPELQLELSEKTIEVIENSFHRMNIGRLKIYRAAYEACIHLKKWNDGIKYGKEVLQIYRYYLGEFDASLVVFVVNFGKTCMNAGQTDKGKQLIFGVFKTYESIFGKNSEAVLELGDLLKLL